MATKYEMHVNGYEIGVKLEPRLLNLGFFVDPFLQTGNRHTPPNHFTFVVFDDPQTRTHIWSEALKVIKADRIFKGYFESETVPEGYCSIFAEPQQFSHGKKFPLPRCETMEVPAGTHKAADIHVKRSLNWKRDELDDLLLAHNFYEVHTSRNRIFTFQTEHFRDAKEAYRRLSDYFLEVGGVKQVDLEITGKFYRMPKDFPVARIVPTGLIVNS